MGFEASWSLQIRPSTETIDNIIRIIPIALCVGVFYALSVRVMDEIRIDIDYNRKNKNQDDASHNEPSVLIGDASNDYVARGIGMPASTNAQPPPLY